MTRELSPEEYRQMVSSGQLGQSQSKYRTYALTAAIIVACLLVGFVIGMQYEKGTLKSRDGSAATATHNGGYGAFVGRGGSRRTGSIGQVTAVSSDSVTIQNTRTGGSRTFKISSSTTVANNGATASVSDIKTGDTIMIRTSATDTSTATTILLNPSLGGMGAIGSNPDNSTNSTETPTTLDPATNSATI